MDQESWNSISVVKLHHNSFLVLIAYGSLLHSIIRMTIVNIEVETDEEDHGDQERDKGEENELLEKARFFQIDSELILFFGQFVTVTFQ